MTLTLEQSPAGIDDDITPNCIDANSRLFSYLKRLNASRGDAWFRSSEHKRIMSWLNSHTTALTAAIETGIAEVNFDCEADDLRRLYTLYDGQSTYMSRGKPASKISLAHEILYGDREHGARQTTAQPGEYLGDVLARITSGDIVRSIATQVIRTDYLTQLAERHPDALTKERLEGLLDIYDNNIRSDFLLAGHYYEREVGRCAVSDIVRSSTTLQPAA